ncbi:MAG: oligosaccharide flippase family protein [Candidatus Alcyoniella australis]|nr:oligosaccharide flippase family protein [Candidatus Alcyoniella australis]
MNNEGLSRRFVRSTALVAGGTYLNQLLNFAANVALMRLIVPEYFGQMALGLFFLSLCRRAFGLGINAALIHRQDDLDRAYGVHLGLNLLIGVLTLGVVALASPLVAARYDHGVIVALWAFALAGLAEAATHTPRLALEKRLEFKRLMAARVSNTLLVNAVAIVVAIAGYGLEALILRYVLGVLYDLVLVWILAPIRPRLCFDRKLVRWFLRFGAQLWFGGLASFTIYQLDDWFVGTLVGAVALGFYSRSYNTSLLPTSMVSQVVAKVAFPVYARLQNDRAALSAVFGATTRGVALLTLPFSALLFLVAPELVSILFGQTWMPMVPMLRALILFSACRPLFDNTGDLFSAVGRPQTSSRIQVGQALSLALLLWPATYFGQAIGAALAVGVVMLGGVVAAYVILRQAVDVRYRELFTGPLAASLIALGLSFAVVSQLGDPGQWAAGLCKLCCFAILFLLLIALIEGQRLRRDLRDVVRLLQGRPAEVEDV